jgi:hypothetical protein
MMEEHDVAALLRAAVDDIDVATAPAEGLVSSGRQSVRRRRTLGTAASVAAVAAVAVAVSLQVDPPWSSTRPASTPQTSAPMAAGCRTPVPDRVLPSWARGGFSDPKPRTTYVRGGKNDVVAILFGQPLTAPPSADHNNKILWVSRLAQEPVTDLRIRARLIGGSATANRRVSGGPGPSIIDLPQPGCWHLSLRWSGHSDSLDLAYLPD